MRSDRAELRAFALAIAADIHPLNNLRVLKYLKDPLGHDQATIDGWYRHWVELGLGACEELVRGAAGAVPTASARRRRSPTSASSRRSPMRAA